MTAHSSRRSRAAATVGLASLVFVAAQCGTTSPPKNVDPAARARSADAFATVYRVLQHPRCLNCHPSGNAPLQGDGSHVHRQGVVAGSEGKGVFGMRCASCHFDPPIGGTNLPPGAPNWHLPHPRMPLVFQGLTPAQLARQLADPERNGNKTPEQLLDHVAHDRLVLWGWNPGEGRTPVPVPHAEFVAAMKTWIDGGCAVPE